MASLAALLDDIDENPSEKRVYYFENEIQKMMFACGDSVKPLLESAHLIERIVHQQLVSMLLQAQEVAEMRESKYIRVEDILFLMRKDKLKLRRAVKFLCFTDTRQNLCSDLMGNFEKRTMTGGKRRQLCKDFLLAMDSTGQLLDWVNNDSVFDEVKEDRKVRAEQRSNSFDAEEYVSFAQARGQSFTHSSNTNSVKLRAWLFADGNFLGESSRPQLPLGHGIHMEIVGYVAYETLAQIIDFALLVRRDANALATDPINRLMPPSLFTPAVLPAPKRTQPLLMPFSESKSKPLKIEGTAPLTPNEIREAVQRYCTQISLFNLFSRNMYNAMHRQLFCT